ncbi:MAG: ribosomal RNA small subunit methyltransferase H [Patescibacteria group bacterium]|nr:MAG: ribosomal RNA small subunit methyltransferase H [Patescibacteria group bacterium]
MNKHTPVLHNKVINELKDNSIKKIIDATAGQGGYLKNILADPTKKVLAIDIDPNQIKRLKEQFDKQIKNKQLILKNGNFAYLDRYAKQHNFIPAQAVIFDLGLSWDQMISFKKGFSYKQKDDPLDMRFNTRFKYTAADLINNLSENELLDILMSFGEEPLAYDLAKEIIRTRSKKSIKTVSDLNQIIEKISLTGNESVFRRVYQALRIAVNNEYINLKQGLNSAYKVLDKNGKILCLTFNPTEDRIVKRFIKEKNLQNKTITNKKARANFEKIATLRVILKTYDK